MIRFAALLCLAMLGCGASPESEDLGSASSAVTSPTTVTIQFDDGTSDQYRAREILSGHGMHATFYINSGVVGDSSHLSWTQLHDLANDGNEIAGHTTLHTNLKKLSTTAARQAVCGDRNTLLGEGFPVSSFAYPFGSFDTATQQVVRDCGYNSGRGVSGVDSRSVFAELIPPPNAYATRTPPNPKKATKLATIQGYITAAEQHGGGWIQLVFHRLSSSGAYSITEANFIALLDWLQPRAGTGTVVRTTAEVIGGPVNPPVAP